MTTALCGSRRNVSIYRNVRVYFEAGYAIGLGLPVIWSVHEDDLRNVHFDTRQYNHIVWKDADDLEQQIYNRVSAVIGGPDD